EVTKAFYDVIYWQEVREQYEYLDSLYQQFTHAANRRFELGETNYLEKLTAESQQKELALLLAQTEENIYTAYQELHTWLQTDNSVTVQRQELRPIPLEEIDSLGHPGIKYYQEAIRLSERSIN